ncbi:breast cancer type 2 susceptibility protein isoform X1 [Mobula birostris]|uniref:breast cancer type 2 susceptibility protein isoform X1 n=2 Tax=Mobula birostris TaxID=1983395 RepID=UPI003B27B9C0
MKEQNSNQLMFDFVALCREDLEPLCQNWFEELTLSACSDQFKQPGADVHIATSGHNNDYFKTPWQKQNLHSQLECTPLIFSGFPLITSVCTSDQRNEKSKLKPENSSALIQRAAPPNKGSHHKTSSPVFDVSIMKSPAVLNSTCRTPQHIHVTQDDRSSFFSPPAANKVMSEQILESLGAEMDPDMSWTSSLATPPSLTPTVIICKAKESELLQDKVKEVQVPLFLHSNLNKECNAFGFGQRMLPVIGEEENEEIEEVDQSCSLTICRKNEDGASPENILCIDFNETNGKHGVEAKQSLQDGNLLLDRSGKIEDDATYQYLKDEAVDKLSRAFNNDSCWDNFVTPLNRRPSQNKKRRIFTTACHTVAKRLSMESEMMMSNSFVHGRDAEEKRAPAVINYVQAEKVNVSDNTVKQHNEKSCFEPLADEKQSSVHHDVGEIKFKDNNSLGHLDNTCITPFSDQLSTNVITSTSAIIHTLSSHPSCRVLHKTEQFCPDSENCNRTLKNQSSVSELQIKPNIETVSICLSQERHFERNLVVEKELLSANQKSDLHNLLGSEKGKCSETNLGIQNRKIAVLASTLKTRKLKAAISDAFLVSSTVLPEYELYCKDNIPTKARKVQHNLSSSALCGLGMHWSKSSESTSNLHNKTRTDLPASVTKTELHKLAEITLSSHNIEPYKEENTDRTELKYGGPGTDLNSVIKKEICAVLESTKNLISEPYNYGSSNRDLSEHCTNLPTESSSQEKLCKKIKNDNLEANSAQAAILKLVTSRNTFEDQEGDCPISSINPEIKTKSPESQISMEVVNQSSSTLTKMHTFDSSVPLAQKNLDGDYKYLTASQAEDVSKLFTMLEDTNSQFEFTQFGKESAVSDVDKSTHLLIEQLQCTHPSALDKRQDINSDVNPSIKLNNKLCNSQPLTKFSETLISSEIYQQTTEEMDKTIPNKLIASFGFISKNKEIAAFTVPKLYINSLDSVKIHTDTKLNSVNPPLKDKVSFKGDQGGFCTASGSVIKPSVESLKKAENIFRDIGNDFDKTSDQVLATDALSYLLSNSVCGSKEITEDCLGDIEAVKSSESNLLHPALFNLSSKNSQDNILQNEKIVNSDRKDDFQLDGTRSANILEDASLQETMHLSTEHNVLEKSDSIDVVKLGRMKNTAWKKYIHQSDCGSATEKGHMEFGSKIELSDDHLSSRPSASHIRSTDEAINTEESNDLARFQIANGRGVGVPKTDLLKTKDCCNENLQKPKLPIGIEKNASQQLNKRMNASQIHLGKIDAEEQLCDQKQTCQAIPNHLVSAAFIARNDENSEPCNSLRNRQELILTNTPFTARETAIKGFQTASGKMVNVCKASLDKAKALFAEKDLLDEAKHTMKNISSESLHASNSTTLIQNAIKSGTVKQLKDNHSHVNSKSPSRLHDFSNQSEHIFDDLDLDTDIEMKGFQMASGKQVSVSKAALNKGKALFLDDACSRFTIQHSFMSPETFKNASSKGSALNDNVLGAKPPPHRLDKMNQVNSLLPKQCLAYCASNGSSISVGEANLKYAEEKYVESESGESKVLIPSTSVNNQGNFTGDTVFELPQQFLKRGSTAFSTASGKSVQVSEESLKKCKQIFAEVAVSEDDFKIFSDKVVKSKGRKHSDTSCTKASLGFTTASGKPVLVSDVALQKVKCMLKEFEMNGSSPSSPKCAKSPPFDKAQQLQSSATSLLFSDAIVNNEHQDKGAAELTHKILDDCPERTANMPNSDQVELNKKKINDLEVNRPPRNLSTYFSNTCVLMSGFQTAKGKEVMVEENNLTMARIQLASNKNDKLSHTAERSNTLAEGRINPVCSVNHASTSVLCELKSNYDAHPKVPEETVKSSKVAMDHNEHLDFMSGMPFRGTNAFTDQIIEPDLRTGKRSRLEEKFTKEEPLSKRQLLSKFDNTLQSDHRSTFKPLKCNPEGALCDRRKFMYNIPLKTVIYSPSKVKSLSNNSHQMISPNITIPIHENSVRQDQHLHCDVKSSKGQIAVFKPPFHSHSSDHKQLYKCSQNASKSEQKFLPPFKSVPNVEKTTDMETVICPMENESESIAKASNYSGPLQDGGPLNDYLTLGGHHEDQLQSVTGTSEELKANNEGFSKMIQNWHHARNLQEMRLMKKKRQTVHPLPGSLYRSKTCSSKLSLHTSVEGKAPTHFTKEKLYSYGVNRSTLCVRAENAESFQINSRDFFSEELLNTCNGLWLADGGCLIPDDNGMAGKSEFYRALLDTPGVDSKLISEDWAYNHYRWLVWKVAAMEIAFPKQFGGRCLTPERILLQLKYRYDVEIDQSRRSALKIIMERDDISAKTLVLCISKIISLGSRSSQHSQNFEDAVKDNTTIIEKHAIGSKKDMSFAIIEVTDGWYGIKALLDSPLTTLLQKRRLVIGQKIIVHGAELIGSQDPCSPLEAPESLMLKISANSTRPARWYAKLGFHCDPRPFPLPLSSLFCEGGMIGCVDVIVLRIYPIQWMEKSSSGTCVFRNERAEEREAQIHYENQQRKLEMLYAKIEAELHNQNRVSEKEKREHKVQLLSEQQIMMLQDGKELYEAVLNSSDPLSVEACFSEQQLKALNNYRQVLKEKQQVQIEAQFRKALEDAHNNDSYVKRNVAPLWKLCIVDYKSHDNNAVCMLNIWRPTAELHSLLKEGGRYWICYLSAASCKGRHNYVDLQLTATKKTRYQQLQAASSVLNQLYQPRQAVAYSMLCDQFFRTVCKEVDLAGYVIYILGKTDGPSTVYLADENQDLVAIKFWTSFKQLAVEDIIKPSALVVASNLKWTSESSMGIPVLLTGDLSNFSANPKDGHLREKYIQLKSSVQNIQSFVKDTEEKVKTILGTISTPRSNKNSDDILTPNNKRSSITSISGTLLASPNAKRKPPTLSTTENGSKSTLCSPKITPAESLTELKKRKLKLLSQIPSPVPLPHLSTCVSPSVQRNFRPPRRCVTPQNSEEAIQMGNNKSVHVSALKKTEISKIAEDNWVTDEELAMIDTQALIKGWGNGVSENDKEKPTRIQITSSKDNTTLSKNVKNYLGTQLSKIVEDNWVTDEELAMINTQALYEECSNASDMKDNRKVERSHVAKLTDRPFMPQTANDFNNELGNKVAKLVEDNWVPDEELAMINTQVLYEHWASESIEKTKGKIENTQIESSNGHALKQNLESEFETVGVSADKSSPVGSQSKRRRKDEGSTIIQVMLSAKERCHAIKSNSNIEV